MKIKFKNIIIFFLGFFLISCEENISSEEYESEEENHVITINDDSEQIKKVRKQIMSKYYTQFENIMNQYEQEDIEKKIVDAKKQFHTLFS